MAYIHNEKSLVAYEEAKGDEQGRPLYVYNHLILCTKKAASEIRRSPYKYEIIILYIPVIQEHP